MAAALAGNFDPGAADWEKIPCDIMHQRVGRDNCAPNRDPGLLPGWPAACISHISVGSPLPCCPGLNSCCKAAGTCPPPSAAPPRVPALRTSASVAGYFSAAAAATEQLQRDGGN